MAVYAVSFTLEDDDTYPSRYASLVEQIRLKGEAWEETTSFALVKTDETLVDFEHRLYFKSTILESKDLLLVVDVTDRSGLCRGKNGRPTRLATVAPAIKQIKP